MWVSFSRGMIRHKIEYWVALYRGRYSGDQYRHLQDFERRKRWDHIPSSMPNKYDLMEQMGVRWRKFA